MSRALRTVFRLALLFGAQIASAASVSVLFVGNSLTEVNDLPTVFKHFAAESSSHMDVDVSSITPGGALLYDHWKSGHSLALLQERHPDFLVLQGQSTEPLSARESFKRSAALFKSEADRVHTTTILFATWARPAGDPYYKEPSSGGSPERMQTLLTLAYASVARTTGATLAPVGVGFEHAKEVAPEIRLLDGTQHPSPAGTYLAAAILFRAMFKEPAAESTFCGGLPKEIALRLQRVASEISMSPSE